MAVFKCCYCAGLGCEECERTGQTVVTPLSVDGNVVMVHGNRELTDEGREALKAVYRAALKRMAEP